MRDVVYLGGPRLIFACGLNLLVGAGGDASGTKAGTRLGIMACDEESFRAGKSKTPRATAAHGAPENRGRGKVKS